jgi:tripartite-type tricarboxylate transporter receptor subunit TctC
MAASMLLATLGTTVLAQGNSYPQRPLKLIAPTSPGGAPDTIARVLAEKLAPLLGQPVVVENRAGANGYLATETTARAAADGYTLGIFADSMVVINPHLRAKSSHDTMKDLVPIATVASNTFFLSTHPSIPVKNFREFIEYARNANPPLAYASGGNGSQHQMAMEMLKQRAGINLLHVPYKSGTEATTATMSGEVAAMFSGASTGPQIKAGKLRGLAATGRNRSPLFPDMPTIGEVYPGYEISVWLGFFGPAGFPDVALQRLRAELNKVLLLPEVKDRLNSAGGLEPFRSTPEEFQAMMRADYDRYGKLVRQIGAKLD